MKNSVLFDLGQEKKTNTEPVCEDFSMSPF